MFYMPVLNRKQNTFCDFETVEWEYWKSLGSNQTHVIAAVNILNFKTVIWKWNLMYVTWTECKGKCTQKKITDSYEYVIGVPQTF